MPDPIAAPVKQAFMSLQAAIQRALEPYGMHAGQQYLLLELLREDRQTVGGLAGRLGVEVPTVVRAVQRMEAAGLLRRERDPADARRAIIALTEQGERLRTAIPEALAEVDRRATAGLSDAERAELERLLGRVATNLRRT